MDIAVLRIRFQSETRGLERGFDKAERRLETFTQKGKTAGVVNIRAEGREFERDMRSHSQTITRFKRQTGRGLTVNVRQAGASQAVKGLESVAKAREAAKGEAVVRVVTQGDRDAVSALRSVADARKGAGGKVGVEFEQRGGAATLGVMEAVDEKADSLDGRSVGLNFGQTASQATATRSALVGLGQQMDILSLSAQGLGAQKMPLMFGAAAGGTGVIASLGAATLSLAGALGQGAAGFGLIGGAAYGAARGGFAVLQASMTSVVKEAFEVDKRVGEIAKRYGGVDAYLATLDPKIRRVTQTQLGFVDAVEDTRFAWEKVEGELTLAVLPAMTRVVTHFNKRIPALSPQLVRLAGDVAGVGEEFGTALLRGERFGQVQRVLGFVSRTTTATARGAKDLGLSLLSAVQPVIPAADRLVDRALAVASSVSRWGQSAEGAKTISVIVAGLERRMYQLLDVSGNVGRGIAGVFSALNQSGVGGSLLSGLQVLARDFSRVGAEGSRSREQIVAFARDSEPVLRAVLGVGAEVGRQFLRLARETASFRAEGQKTTLLVQIFESLRRSIGPVADMMLTTFRDVGPLIPGLIEGMAGAVAAFGGSSAPLQTYLGFVNRLLTTFNGLPQPIQTTMINLAAMSSIMESSGGPSISGMVGGFLTLRTQMGALSLATGKNIGVFSALKTSIFGVGPAANSAAAAESRLVASQGRLAASANATTAGQRRMAASMAATSTASRGAAASATAAGTATAAAGAKMGILGRVGAVGAAAMRGLGLAFRFMLGPWGLLISAVAIGAVAIWRNWDKISAAAQPVTAAFNRILTTGRQLGSMVGNILTGNIGRAHDAFLKLPAGVRPFALSLAQATIHARRFGQQALGFVQAQGQRLMAWWAANWPKIQAVAVPILNAVGNAIRVGLVAAFRFAVTQGQRLVSWWNQNLPLIRRTAQVVFGALDAVIGGNVRRSAQIVMAVVGALVGFWRRNHNEILSIARSAWRIVSAVVGNSVRILGNVVKLGMQVITGDWRGAWATVKRIGQLAIETFLTIAREGMRILGNVFTIAGRELNSIWKNRVWDPVSSYVRQKREDIVGTVSGLKDRALDIFNSLPSPVRDAFRAVGRAMHEPISSAADTLKGIWNGLLDMIAKVLDAVRLGDVADRVRGAKFAAGGTTDPRASGPRRSGYQQGERGALAFAEGGVADKKRGGTSGPRNPRWHVWGEGDYHEAYLTTDPRFRKDNDRYAAWYATKVGGIYWPAPTAKRAEQFLWMARQMDRGRKAGNVPLEESGTRFTDSKDRPLLQTERRTYAAGGTSAGDAARATAAWAHGSDGRPYAWGGSWPPTTDCSGWQAVVHQRYTGNTNPSGRGPWGATGGMGSGAMSGWGFRGGTANPGYSVGVAYSGPGGGHTAGTLAWGDGEVNTETGGGAGGTMTGGPAWGATNSYFSNVFSKGDPGQIFGGGGGGGGGFSIPNPLQALFENRWKAWVEPLFEDAKGAFPGEYVLMEAARKTIETVEKGLYDWVDEKIPDTIGGGGGGGSIAGLPGGGNASENRDLGRRMLESSGVRGAFSSLDSLWTKESQWNQRAKNPSSGAYGIPQALPESKLPPEGREAGGSNPGAQIGWGLGYIRDRYGSTDAAWAHSQRVNWYARGGVTGRPRQHRARLDMPRPTARAFEIVARTLDGLASGRAYQTGGSAGIAIGDRGGVGTGKALVGITQEAGPEAIVPLARRTPEGAMALREANRVYGGEARPYRIGPRTRWMQSGGFVNDWNSVRRFEDGSARMGIDYGRTKYAALVPAMILSWNQVLDGAVTLGRGSDVRIYDDTSIAGYAGMAYSDGRLALNPNVLDTYPPYRRAGTIGHEIGHHLGLEHMPPQSIMSTPNTEARNRLPTSYEGGILRDFYGPGPDNPPPEDPIEGSSGSPGAGGVGPTSGGGPASGPSGGTGGTGIVRQGTHHRHSTVSRVTSASTNSGGGVATQTPGRTYTYASHNGQPGSLGGSSGGSGGSQLPAGTFGGGSRVPGNGPSGSDAAELLRVLKDLLAEFKRTGADMARLRRELGDDFAERLGKAMKDGMDEGLANSPRTKRVLGRTLDDIRQKMEDAGVKKSAV